jgi:hypothetical protein
MTYLKPVVELFKTSGLWKLRITLTTTATSKSVHVIRTNATSHPILGLLILPGPKKGSYLPINSVVPSSSQPSNKSEMHKLIPISILAEFDKLNE